MYFFSLLTKITSFRHIPSTEKCVETDYNIYYSDREKVDSLLCVSLLEQKGIMAWHEVTTGGTNDGELFSAPTAQVMLTENARKTIDPWKPGKITYSEAVEHAHTILPVNARAKYASGCKVCFFGPCNRRPGGQIPCPICVCVASEGTKEQVLGPGGICPIVMLCGVLPLLVLPLCAGYDEYTRAADDSWVFRNEGGGEACRCVLLDKEAGIINVYNLSPYTEGVSCSLVPITKLLKVHTSPSALQISQFPQWYRGPTPERPPPLPFDETASKLILTFRSSSNALVFERAKELDSCSSGVPLTLSSHPGLAVVPRNVEKEFKWGAHTCATVELGVGSASMALKTKMDKHGRAGFIASTHVPMPVSDGSTPSMVLDIAKYQKGTDVHLFGDGMHEFSSRNTSGGRSWVVNSDGTISAAMAPYLVLGVLTERQNESTAMPTMPMEAKQKPSPVETTSTGVEAKFCTKCGEEIVLYRVFCTSCGHSVDTGWKIVDETPRNRQ